MTLMQELAHSKQSEIVVLGYAISSATGLQTVCSLLKERDFHSTQHRSLFQVLQRMHQNNAFLDIHLLREELKKQKILVELGGKAFLAHAVELFLDCEHAEECIEEVKRLSLLREMLSSTSSYPIVLSRESGKLAVRYYIFFKNHVFVGECAEQIGQKVLIDLKAFEISLQDQSKG